MRNVFALAIGLCLAAPQVGLSWMTDLHVAQNRAYAENRLVLVNFTGSDWCGWCIKLKSEVFSRPEFTAFAERHLMLVEVDFPRRTPISAQQRSVNKALANKYGVEGYPTIILLNSKGDQIAHMGYMPGGPAPFIKAIRQHAGMPATDSARPGGGDSSAPAFGGARTGPPPKYTELTLKSITGAGSKRLALINNQTLALGESAKVRLGAGEVKVRVEEIREKSVVVTIEGTGRKELVLKDS
jgi:protein disulfide-isomerase